MYYCFGVCEWVYVIFVERFILYMINDKFNWEECLLFIVFFINCFVNISLGYLLYEIVFLRRLKFFLVNYYSELGFDSFLK